MNATEKKYGWLADPIPGFVSWKHEADKVIVFERARVLFVFNFHSSNSFTDYKVARILITSVLEIFYLIRLSETSQKSSSYLLSTHFRSEYGTRERTKLCLTQTHQNMEVTPESIQLFNILLSMKNMRDADSVWIFIYQAEQRWCWPGLAVGKRKEPPVIENLRCLERISGAKIYLSLKK